MKNLKKKGFTIVELVIVIAVVAVLAAVLIPTFVNLTRKANISSDTVLAKNLNTALSLYQAENEVAEFDDALEGIKDYGYLIANLNAKTSGCFFVWEQETNQILLVDSKDNYNVLFSVREGYGEPDASWHFAISNKEIASTVKAAKPDVTIQQTIASIEDLNSWLEDGGTQVVYFDESLVIEDSKSIKVTGGDITFNLGNSSVSTKGVIEGSPIFLENGNLTIKGGTINANGIDNSIFGNYYVGIGYEVDTKLVVDGVNFIGNTAINGTWQTSGQIDITVKDSTFNVENSGIVVSPGAVQNSEESLKVLNCNVTAGEHAIFISQGTKLVVDGGYYKGQYALRIANSGAASSAVIKSGTFDGKIEIAAGSLLIESGTFYNTGLTETAFRSYVESGATVTVLSEGSYEVK